MADDKGDRGPADRSRVNIHEDYEITYWTGKYGCTSSQLIHAVQAVGVMADKVEDYLRRQGWRK